MKVDKNYLLLTSFHLYSSFFENENKVSLLDRRDFKNIYYFKELFREILDEKYEQDKIIKLQQAIRRSVKIDYYDHLKKSFGSTIISEIKSQKLLEAYSADEKIRNSVIDLFNDAEHSLSNFFKSYSILSNTISQIYLEELLIEFHNYLSHCVQAIINKESFNTNIQRANAHLHRAVLDAFKVIIHSNRNIIRENVDLLEEFNTIRGIELGLIGILENDSTVKYTKNDIQIKYCDLAKRLVNLPS